MKKYPIILRGEGTQQVTFGQDDHPHPSDGPIFNIPWKNLKDLFQSLFPKGDEVTSIGISSFGIAIHHKRPIHNGEAAKVMEKMSPPNAKKK